MIKRRKLYQITFLLAGIYNICWGLWAAFDPNWLFRFANMQLLNHADIFACLGMVVGLYGVLYLEVARRPERGFLIAAIGLIGKILGPIGLIVLIRQGKWTAASFVMCLTNDLIWWIPFGLYVKDSWKFYKQDLQIGL